MVVSASCVRFVTEQQAVLEHVEGIEAWRRVASSENIKQCVLRTFPWRKSPAVGTPRLAAHERWLRVTPPTTEAEMISVGLEKYPFSPTLGMARRRMNWSTTLLLQDKETTERVRMRLND
jgi:hypothetical protein